MSNVSNVLFNVLYADDTCINISDSDINALFDVLNIELAALLEWLNANQLTLNVDKTFYMLFHNRRVKTDNLKLTIGQGMLKQTSKSKYLGLLIFFFHRKNLFMKEKLNKKKHKLYTLFTIYTSDIVYNIHK